MSQNERLELALKLLRVAECPMCHGESCVEMPLETVPCEWCHNRAIAITEPRSPKNALAAEILATLKLNLDRGSINTDHINEITVLIRAWEKRLATEEKEGA